MNLKDKVVVITGGSKGFGKALAKAFLDEGSTVIISSNNDVEIKAVAKEIGASGICADVTKEEDLMHLANKTVKKFGVIDIWINNAGIWIKKALVEDLDMSLVRKMFEVNVVGTINGCRVALRVMKEKGTGTIINIISDSALKLPRISASVYSASKWAVNGFTKSAREENTDISILSIYPGAMKTEIFGENKPNNYSDFMEPEYVAERVIDNLKKENPEEELVIQRPTK